jgi:tRNA(Ile)-lysidine synthase
MHKQVLETIHRFRMITPGLRVAVACSGGPDSTGLLQILQQLAAELGCSLSVVHFNHKLRSAESDADEQFVRELAHRLRLPFHVASHDVRLRAGRTGENIEDAGRRLRYDYFVSLVESGSADRIAVGHTADDQAETVLHRLVRGAGSRGLAAIYPTVGNWLIRPLIETRRQDVLKWLRSRQQTWRVDSTNQDLRYARNRIRHRLLPALAELNPSIVSVLSHGAEIAREEEAFWDVYLEPLVQQHLQRSRAGVRLDVAPLRDMPVAAARRFLRYALEEAAEAARSAVGSERSRKLGRSTGASDFGHVQRVLALALRGQSGATLSLPGRIRARREFSTLWLEAAGTDPIPFRGYSYQVSVPETVAVPEIPSSFVFELIPLASAMARYNGNREELLDRDVIRESLVLRSWQAGDSYRPNGHRKSRKIKELFQRWRVLSDMRRRWPVVVAGGRIVWSRRWGTAQGFEPRPGSVEALRIREID